MKLYEHKKKLALVLFLLGLGVGFYYLRHFQTRLSGFITDLSARSPLQRQNIERTSKELSGIVLEAGQVFSFNERLGPYNEEKGYRPERSFVGKEVQKTAGGGICQVASTLYNSAKIAGLEILERVPHSQEVESVGPGMDATIAYGVADLKFKNPYRFPIEIVSNVSKDQLKIEIWGDPIRKGL